MLTLLIEIRDATTRDYIDVVHLLKSTLAPVCSQYHCKLTENLLRFSAKRSHASSSDRQSVDQRMFVAMVNGAFAGFSRVIGNRHRTYSLSPLIVSEDYRGSYGVGHHLLRRIEDYARLRGGTQLHCEAYPDSVTVNFYRRHQFLHFDTARSESGSGRLKHRLYKTLAACPNSGTFGGGLSVLHAGDVPGTILRKLVDVQPPLTHHGVVPPQGGVGVNDQPTFAEKTGRVADHLEFVVVDDEQQAHSNRERLILESCRFIYHDHFGHLEY